jgi:hypothetical protein
LKKIPTVFERDWNGDRSRVVDQVHAGCEWVLAGEGWPTRKIDGTCCMVRDGRLLKRRELRKGEAAPADFEPADFDEETGKTVGWMPVGDGPEDAYHREAFAAHAGLQDGTYELLGPKVQGNPEGLERHDLVSHDSLAITVDVPRDFAGLQAWLAGKDMEGLVFHHPDGRRAKIKLRDFGLKRNG